MEKTKKTLFVLIIAQLAVYISTVLIDFITAAVNNYSINITGLLNTVLNLLPLVAVAIYVFAFYKNQNGKYLLLIAVIIPLITSGISAVKNTVALFKMIVLSVGSEFVSYIFPSIYYIAVFGFYGILTLALWGVLKNKRFIAVYTTAFLVLFALYRVVSLLQISAGLNIWAIILPALSGLLFAVIWLLLIKEVIIKE